MILFFRKCILECRKKLNYIYFQVDVKTSYQNIVFRKRMKEIILLNLFKAHHLRPYIRLWNSYKLMNHNISPKEAIIIFIISLCTYGKNIKFSQFYFPTKCGYYYFSLITENKLLFIFTLFIVTSIFKKSIIENIYFWNIW